MTTILDIPGSNPPNPFCTPIQAFLACTNLSSEPGPALDEIAGHLVTVLAASSNPTHALWELWDAFFTAVTNSTSYTRHLALLDGLRSQPPTQPKYLYTELRRYLQADRKLHWSPLPRFSSQWRNVHDILQAWCDWDGMRVSHQGDNSITSTLSSSCAEFYLRFCTFSAALVKANKGKGEVSPIWVFHMCHDVLERKGPESRELKAHRMLPEQVWALDVRVTAIWMRDGGQVLWETDPEELQEHWAPALEDKTELWPRTDGLTRERWQLWAERLLALSTDKENLDEETRAVVTQAAEVVTAVLEENLA